MLSDLQPFDHRVWKCTVGSFLVILYRGSESSVDIPLLAASLFRIVSEQNGLQSKPIYRGHNTWENDPTVTGLRGKAWVRG